MNNRPLRFPRNRPILIHAILLGVAVVVSLVLAGPTWAQETNKGQVGDPEIQDCLELSGENRDELVKAIRSVPDNQREALKFLIRNMPEHDLKTLSADFLLSNVRLAFRARAEAPWEVPDDVFLNDVLPYANIDEPRDPWRKEFFDLCRPIVKDCKTPAEAAQKLNETVFKQISVKYSTARKRANQSPQESIQQGLASCTGLSIILSDACRSVGVPARIAGIPRWKNKPGNHTWVEIWDGEKWHFTGAAEPNPKGLNHAWFQGDAALADPNSKMHSIYATSFRKTETAFPMVWSPEKRVYAENVTARYLPSADSKTRKETISVMIRVWNADRTQREVVDVEVLEQEVELSGRSKGGTADMNDLLTFELKPDTNYKLSLVRSKSEQVPALSAIYALNTGKEPNQLVEIELSDLSSRIENPGKGNPENNEDENSLDPVEQNLVARIADAHFINAESANTILASNPAAVRELVWNRYLVSPRGLERKSDFDNKQVTFQKHLSPYTIKEVGKRPENGWPLFIAMHGGGGAPQKLNDSQWKHMQIYYKDQNQVTGYKYLSLRAPNNTWNGFYDDYVYPLVENLVRQFIVFGDVDPNKVFIMGYSHGGYGAFAIGPKIPYRFAAIHASAAAPTDGQTSAKTLTNTRFTFMVGEKDTAHGRRQRCEKFAEQTKDCPTVEFMYKEGFGHGGLPDRDMIGEMYAYVRNPVPKHLTWEMTDSVVKRFFWLAVDNPERGQLIDAEIIHNTINVTTENCNSFSIFVDQRSIDPGKPIEIVLKGKPPTDDRSFSVEYKPSLKTLCRTIAETGDINLSFDFEIEINIDSSK